MSATVLVLVLFLAGLLVLVAEIFIPSHGLLSIVGLGFLAAAVYQAYTHISNPAGHWTFAAVLIVVPTMAWIAVKTFHYTPWGKKLAPPNPVVQVNDFAPELQQLKSLIGQQGRSITPLRPVGTCIFTEQRVNCVAESGMLATGTEVVAIDLRGNSLVVRPAHSRSDSERIVSS
ncbi:MAG: hypothetical protein HJJLKODD_00423 [Phycisphaerae bacterium]|nr:hypothetical protein [Phycisphaerae bacterium]